MQMIDQGKKESQQSMTMMMNMMQTMNQSQQQSFMQMLPLLVSQKGGGPDEIMKYAELFKNLRQGDTPSADEEDNSNDVGKILENVADIVSAAPEAIKALQAMQGGGGAAPIQVPKMVPVPGSAASLVQGLPKT